MQTSRQRRQQSCRNRCAIDYAVGAAKINARTSARGRANLVKGDTGTNERPKLDEAATSMEQSLPLQCDSSARFPLVAKVRSNANGITSSKRSSGVTQKRQAA